jgi:hypothetical protein
VKTAFGLKCGLAVTSVGIFFFCVGVPFECSCLGAAGPAGGPGWRSGPAGVFTLVRSIGPVWMPIFSIVFFSKNIWFSENTLFKTMLPIFTKPL